MTKKLWRYQASLLVQILNEARKVDSMNYDAGNDDVTLLDLLIGLLCVVHDDNTGVQVGRNFPIYEIIWQANRFLVLTSESVECGDHEFSSEKLKPSATLRMNLIETPGESLFSGIKDVNGWVYMSVHDAMMDRSTGLNHVVNIYRMMRDKV